MHDRFLLCSFKEIEYQKNATDKHVSVLHRGRCFRSGWSNTEKIHFGRMWLIVTSAFSRLALAATYSFSLGFLYQKLHQSDIFLEDIEAMSVTTIRATCCSCKHHLKVEARDWYLRCAQGEIWSDFPLGPQRYDFPCLLYLVWRGWQSWQSYQNIPNFFQWFVTVIGS